MIRVSAIVLAAGRGKRFKSKVSKPLIKINSKPLIIYSLYALSRSAYVKEIIVTVNPSNRQDIIKSIRKYKIKKVAGVVLGGKRRQDSVLRGLKAVDPGASLVLIHDAARPFIDGKTISAATKEAARNGAAIVGVPVKATIKRVTGYGKRVTGNGLRVTETLDRENLREIQTPQVFKKDLILKAYKKFSGTFVTDDASLVEKLGVKVRVVTGSYSNIKVTTPEDLVLAEALACHTE